MEKPVKLIPLTEAASVLGVSLSTLYRWSSQRRIETVKVGSRCLVRPETLSAFIDSNTRPAVTA